MTGDFVYSSLPAVRCVFRRGAIGSIAEEVRRLGCKRALVVTSSTPRAKTLGQRVQQLLGDLDGGLYPHAVMHSPISVNEAAVEHVRTKGIDVLIAVGGGSVIGLTKNIALRTDLPQICIVTTYSGSECTPIVGELRDGVKHTQKTNKVLPEVLVYDVDLTLELPLAISVTSAVNALAHAVEAIYSTDANPVTDQLAESGIQSIARALPRLVADLHDVDARSDLLYGAYCCGTVLGSVAMHLHHKLCHTIGGTFNLDHAQMHTVLLPHATAYNSVPSTRKAIEKIAAALGAPSGVTAAQAIFDLVKQAGGPTALRDIGFPEEGIERCADLALKNPYPNPAPLEREKLVKLLRDAYEGRRPEM